MVSKVKKYFSEFKLLMSEIPAWALTMFVVSIVLMNLFANKSINLPISWLALDCGIIFAWAPFLSMDLIVKHFGAKASIKVSLLATAINVVVSVLFFIAAVIPGMWGESFNFVDMNTVNQALDNTVGGNWYILFGSTVAFIVASIVNAITNEFVGKLSKKDTYGMFTIRTYVSTFIGQFVDNLVFSLIVSQILFGWTLTQCFFCALTGAIVELMMEALFTPIGWRVCKKWKERNVGQNYLSHVTG